MCPPSLSQDVLGASGDRCVGVSGAGAHHAAGSSRLLQCHDASNWNFLHTRRNPQQLHLGETTDRYAAHTHTQSVHTGETINDRCTQVSVNLLTMLHNRWRCFQTLDVCKKFQELKVSKICRKSLSISKKDSCNLQRISSVLYLHKDCLRSL